MSLYLGSIVGRKEISNQEKHKCEISYFKYHSSSQFNFCSNKTFPISLTKPPAAVIKTLFPLLSRLRNRMVRNFIGIVAVR